VDSTDNVTINTWKQQLDGATRVVEAVAAGSIKVGEAQLRAAADAKKSIDAARRMIDAATDTHELWRLQSELFSANVRRSFALWNELNQAAAETQASVSRFLYEPGAALVPQPSVLPEASKTALGLLDDAYRRWRNTTLQIWGASQEIARQFTPVEDAAQAEEHAPSRGKNDHGSHRKSRQDA